MSRILACVVLLCAVVSAQDSPSFEVASIRPASPQTNDVRAGVRIAGAQVRFVSMSLKDLIGTASSVKLQQINAGVTLPPQALRVLDGANADPLSGPLRDVGLTLESGKAPLSVVVVDTISKTPTEN